MTATVLRCLKCGATSLSNRRGKHAPCGACAVEGRGVQPMMPAAPPDRSEPPPPAALRMMGGAPEPFTPEKQRHPQGCPHIFAGRECARCGCPCPQDPASGTEMRELEKSHALRRGLTVAALVLAVACGGHPSAPLTGLYTVRVEEHLDCAGCVGRYAVAYCDAVLNLSTGRGWADCSRDFVDASGKALPAGHVEMRFGPAAGPWAFVCDLEEQPGQAGFFVGGVTGGGFDPARSSCTAERWMP